MNLSNSKNGEGAEEQMNDAYDIYYTEEEYESIKKESEEEQEIIEIKIKRELEIERILWKEIMDNKKSLVQVSLSRTCWRATSDTSSRAMSPSRPFRAKWARSVWLHRTSSSECRWPFPRTRTKSELATTCRRTSTRRWRTCSQWKPATWSDWSPTMCKRSSGKR